jgi:hypothetical protein
MRWLVRILMIATLAPIGCAVAVQEKAKDEAPPVVRKAECRRTSNAIRINGVLDDIAWDNAQELKEFAVFWQKRKSATTTTAKLLWDNKHLYFCAEMEDSDLFALTRERNGMTWEDDVFELFFKPSAKKPAYYEFQVNALGTHLELYLPSRGAGGYRRFAPETKLGMESVVKLSGSLNKYEDKDKGWLVEGRIPWMAFKEGRPKPGDVWKFALCRYDYSVYLEAPDLSSTAPLTQRDFHRYEDYGDLTFVGDKE